MSNQDKNIKIDFTTTSDTSGANDARDSIEGFNDEVEKGGFSGQKFVKAQEEITESNKGVANSTEDATEAIKANTKAKQENADSESQNPLTRDELDQESFGRLDVFKKKEGAVNSLGKSFTNLGGKVVKFGGRLTALYGIITTGGSLLGGFLKKVAESGRGIQRFGDDLELTGQQGGGLVRWLGATISKLQGVGDVVKRTLNPLGAYISATRDAADAQRELARVEDEIQRKLAKREALLQKEIKAINDSNKAKMVAKLAAIDLEKVQNDWADSIDRVNISLAHQLEIQREQKSAADNRIDDAERDANADVEARLEQGVISTEQAEREKYNIFRRAASQRELLQRRAFEEEEKIREKQIDQQESIVNRNEDRKSSLESIQNDFLTKDEVDQLDKDRKAFNRDGDDVGVAQIDNQLSRNEGARKKAENAGFTDKATLDQEITDLANAIKEARSEIGELNRQGEISGLREQNRRSDAVRDFAAENSERRREFDRSRNDERGNVDSEIQDVAKRALNLANQTKAPSPAIQALQSSLSSLEDGASSGEVSGLGDLLSQFSRYIDRSEGQNAANVTEINQLKSKLTRLTQQVSNNR